MAGLAGCGVIAHVRRHPDYCAPRIRLLLDHDAHRAVRRLVRLVYSSIRRGIDQRTALGLTAMQWEPVLLLQLRRADTVAALARSARSTAVATRMLGHSGKHLLKRRRSEQDRRVVHLQLTTKGQAVAEQVRVAMDELRPICAHSPREISTLTLLNACSPGSIRGPYPGELP
jgi:hypothetical protein